MSNDYTFNVPTLQQAWMRQQAEVAQANAKQHEIDQGLGDNSPAGGNAPQGGGGQDQPFPMGLAVPTRDLTTQDPISLLAERLGKIRGAQSFNRGSLETGPAMRENEDLQDQAGPIEQALRGNEQEQSLRSQLLAAQVKQAERLPLTGPRGPHTNGTVVGGMPQSPSLLGGALSMGSDPLTNAHLAALDAAMKYLKINKPHLFSSLGS